MFQNQSSLLQSWLQLRSQLDVLTKQVSFEKQKLKDAEDCRDRLYNKLPWFYLCRATAEQIQRYNESKADVADAKKALAAVEERERKFTSNKEAVYYSMLDQNPNYRAAKQEVETQKLLSSKGKNALSAVQGAFNQLKTAISEKENDLVQDIRERQVGESKSGFRNWSVSLEFDGAKSKIRYAKQIVMEFCEDLQTQLPEEAIKLRAVLPFVDESIGSASCGDWWTDVDDDPLYGTHLIQKMSMVQGQLQILVPPLAATVATCNHMLDQSTSKLGQVKKSFDELLISHRSEHVATNRTGEDLFLTQALQPGFRL